MPGTAPFIYRAVGNVFRSRHNPGHCHFFVILVGAFVCFLPSVVAFNRNHRNAPGVFLLNPCMGWTLLGWVASLVRSVWRERE